MSILRKEIQALRMKQLRIEKKQKRDNAEVWKVIEALEILTLESTGVDAGSKVFIAATKTMGKRGLKFVPKNKN